jgi:hypothetical protein
MSRVLKATFLFLALSLSTKWAIYANETQAPKIVKGANLSQLSFLQGTWRATAGGETTEEIWGSVLGDSMVGHCQSVQNKKTTLFELMAILKDGERVVMRIKHFRNGFTPWKEEDESGDLNLIKLAKDEVTFQNQRKETVTINYKRAGEQLTAKVTVSREGKTNSYPFTYKLVK